MRKARLEAVSLTARGRVRRRLETRESRSEVGLEGVRGLVGVLGVAGVGRRGWEEARRGGGRRSGMRESGMREGWGIREGG